MCCMTVSVALIWKSGKSVLKSVKNAQWVVGKPVTPTWDTGSVYNFIPIVLLVMRYRCPT